MAKRNVHFDICIDWTSLTGNVLLLPEILQWCVFDRNVWEVYNVVLPKRVIKVQKITFPSLLMSCCWKRKPQKCVPSGNFSQVEPLEFVPANFKKSLAYPQNKSPAKILCYTFTIFRWKNPISLTSETGVCFLDFASQTFLQDFCITGSVKSRNVFVESELILKHWFLVPFKVGWNKGRSPEIFKRKQ